MRKVNIDDAVDGMVLAQPVEDKVGRPILKPGDVIKAKFLPQLKKWGVESLVVEGDELLVAVVAPESSDESDRAAQVDGLLENRFARFPDESHMTILKRAARKHMILRKLKP